MILVDTSVWIDHLHTTEPNLVALLQTDEAGTHPGVIEELAVGSITQRHEFLDWLAQLTAFPVLSHTELLALVEHHHLWGVGLSPIDVQLLGAVLLLPGSALWTRDARLQRAASRVGVPLRESTGQ